jgi:hypothetical protein
MIKAYREYIELAREMGIERPHFIPGGKHEKLVGVYRGQQIFYAVPVGTNIRKNSRGYLNTRKGLREALRRVDRAIAQSEGN